MIQFQRVPYEQFKNDLLHCDCVWGTYICASTDSDAIDEKVREIYNNIQLPTRATAGSAGYDFRTPIDVSVSTMLSIYGAHVVTIPTGIRCVMPKNVVLMLYPRSGLGFKNGFRLSNSTGVIDSDFYNAENYGHIMAKFRVDERDLTLHAGDRFMQGVFVNYLVTDDDNATAERAGGFGSTGIQ